MKSELLKALHQWAEAISPGGLWGYGGHTGLWYLNLAYDRSDPYDIIGFRPEDLTTLVRDAEEAPGLREEVARLRADITRRYRQTIDQAMTEMVDERAKLAEEALGDVAVALDKMRIDRDHVHEYNVRLVGRAQDAEAHRDVLAARVAELEAALAALVAEEGEQK